MSQRTQSCFQARPLLSAALDDGDLKGLADPGLRNDYVEHEMFKIIEVAAACVRHAAAKRPRMGQVLFCLLVVNIIWCVCLLIFSLIYTVSVEVLILVSLFFLGCARV